MIRMLAFRRNGTLAVLSGMPQQGSHNSKRLVSCYLWAALISSSPFAANSSFASGVRRTFVLPSIKPRGGSVSDSSTTTLAAHHIINRSQSVALRMSTTAETTSTSTTRTLGEDTMDATTKLTKLRDSMKIHDFDVYLVPSDDPHLSEYVPDAYKRRAFLSGFRGSAGTAVVLADSAFIWTDSRYWNEASLQLDTELWTLQKSGLPDTPTISKWLASTAVEHYEREKKPLRIGMDPYVHSATFAKEVEDALTDAAKNEGLDEIPGVLLAEHQNLVDPVWGESRPDIPVSPFRVHALAYAGMTVADKMNAIREEMVTKKATATVFCTLDDVAYVLNLRAKGDIDTCPVGIAYCLVTEDSIYLYCDAGKVVDVQEHLTESEVTVKPYDQIVSEIEQHCQSDTKNRVWLDKSRANFALANVIPSKQLVDAQNAVTPMKAVKNEAELSGMREAHIVDGAAMAKFMAWLQVEINENGSAVSEVEIDEVLTGYRAEQSGFTECSFPTIAGVDSNGAIIHYRASAGNDLMKYLDKSAPILIDSGGQYLYGTTDVTRTWSFQEQPDAVFVDFYTRVLKGNIGLDSMVFPENTPGLVLDVYARRWLWDIGSDYGHGTGHGVGAALNVHEGPHSISPRWTNTEGLKAGMIVSNEPGYYEDGNFGIRIENLLEILYVNPENNKALDDDAEKPKSTKKKFLKFAKLTMIPIQKNLIDVTLMTEEELDWLDNYHAEVLEKVGPRLEEEVQRCLGFVWHAENRSNTLTTAIQKQL